MQPDLLFENEAEALTLLETGRRAEPPPSLESRQMANSLIQAAPVVAGITEDQQRRQLAARVYQVSRALVGNEMADALGFPHSRTWGVLPMLRMGNRLNRALQRFFPLLANGQRTGQFQKMMELSFYGTQGIQYGLPQHLHAEKETHPPHADRPLDEPRDSKPGT